MPVIAGHFRQSPDFVMKGQTMTVGTLGTPPSLAMPSIEGATLSGKIHQYLGYVFAALVLGGGVVAPFGFYIFSTFIR